MSKIGKLLTRSCRGCKMDCWGKQWDENEKKYFCISDGFYLTHPFDCKIDPQKEKVNFD